MNAEAMRDAVEFSQRTSARGRGKVVLVFPAENMNTIAANALLKTLEEPAGDVKFVLASESAHQLLPTIRSRCLGHTMHWPSETAALDWLGGRDVADADASTFLKAAGGRPEIAASMVSAGWTIEAWAAFPGSMRRGDVAFVKDWSAVQLVDALQKLCHDTMARSVGGSPRFFEAGKVFSDVPMASLAQWSKTLAETQKTMEHPFNAGLMLEALVGRAQTALNSKH